MEAPQDLPLRRQPTKAVYLTYVAVSTLLFRVPFWAITSLVPAYRPRPRWTIGRTLLIRLLQTLIPAVFKTATFHLMRVDPKTFAKQEDAAGVVWVDAAPELVVGEIKEYAELNDVAVEQVPTYWFGDRDPVTHRAGQKAGPGEKVILAFHRKLLSVDLIDDMLTCMSSGRVGRTYFRDTLRWPADLDLYS